MTDSPAMTLRENTMNSGIRTKIKSNFAWLAMDKILAIFHSLIVGAIVARYLGPSLFGILAFANAIGLTVRPLITWGSDNVVTRDFVKQEDDRGDLFWTAFFARIVFGLVAVLGIVICLASGLIELSGDTEAWVVIIYSLPLIFSGFEVANLVLRAKHLNKFAVVATNVVLMAVSITKLILVYQEMSLIWFAAITAANAICAAICIFLITKRIGLIPSIRMPSKRILLSLIQECWPLILSALSVVLYMNVDMIMLRLMQGTEEAGIYSVAVRLSMVWYFIPVVLGTSFLPWLTRTFQDRPSNYLNALGRFFEVNALISYASVAIALISFPTIIYYLFGPDYSESISVFRWHVFGVIFVFMGAARGQHLNLAKLHVISMLSTAAGLVVNVIMNSILIPSYASHGAAIATVVSFAVAGVVSSFFFKDLTDVAWLQVKSWLFAPGKSYSILKDVLRT